jgi:hypothetical protein
MACTFDTAAVALPQGAWSRTQRRYLRDGGRLVLGITQGDFRSYLFPLFTPAGVAVTSEAPADHPHHQSVWIGADHVHALVAAGEGQTEEYTYNFYVNDVFQGRAPGRIVERDGSFEPTGHGGGIIRQRLDWLGPAEWAAPDGRQVLQEERVILIEREDDATTLRIRSVLHCGRWPVRLGPTRHAYFNARVAESMQVSAGGRALDQDGNTIGHSQTPVAEWVDCVGPVGHGREAGIALMPLTDRDEGWWFVSDWGVMTWGPFRRRPRALEAGQPMTQQACVIAHDGDVGPARLRYLRDRVAQRALP